MNEGVSASFLKIGEVNALGGDKRLAISIPLSIEMAQVIDGSCQIGKPWYYNPPEKMCISKKPLLHKEYSICM